MSNQGDRFAGGFLAGTIFGGIVGGIVGTLVANRLNGETEEGAAHEGNAAKSAQKRFQKIRQRVLSTPSEDINIEEARQGLEDKIAQLNDAIDQARQQLSRVNASGEDSSP